MHRATARPRGGYTEVSAAQGGFSTSKSSSAYQSEAVVLSVQPASGLRLAWAW